MKGKRHMSKKKKTKYNRKNKREREKCNSKIYKIGEKKAAYL